MPAESITRAFRSETAWGGRPSQGHPSSGRADPAHTAAHIHLAAAAALALGIFWLDALSPLQGAAAVLYSTVVLIAARSQCRKAVVVAGVICGGLAFAGYGIMHWKAPVGEPAMRLTVSLIAIGITTALANQSQHAADDKRRSELRYRTIFDAAGFPIWESDWSYAYSELSSGAPAAEVAARAAAHAHIRDANLAAGRLFGFETCSGITGRGIAEHYTANSVCALGRIFSSLMRGDGLVEEEAQFRTLAGNVVEVVLRVTLPPGHDGWKHVLVMALDVTERNRAQDNLAKAQAELTQVSRLTTLGELAASIAHEINQPLSAVITYAQSGQRWLARAVPDADEVGECLDHIARNATRAAEIITRIRAAARKGEAEPTSIVLPSLIQETAALLAREFDGNGIDLKLDMADDVPVVIGDRVQIQQVVMNLMLNASQAMSTSPAGERNLRVSAALESGGAVVSVHDSGPGLPGSGPDRLFSPFFTTKPDGLGLGLSIGRSIAENHGGTLTARNDPVRGAVFRLWLSGGDPDEGTA